jgi:hypothetical protein
LSGRTDEPVLLGLIDECAAVKQLSATLIVHATIGRHVRKDAFGFAGFRLFSVGIAGIGDHMQHLSRTTHRRLCRFGHGQQAAIVSGFGRDLLGHDQRMLTIDGCLHIVGGHFGATGGAHEVCFRFSVLLQFLQSFGDLAGLDHQFLVLVNFPGVARPVTISAGVAEFPVQGGTCDQLVKAADEALCAAKQSGRNRVVTAQMLRRSF